MATLECPFCNQANPGAATFCMACGSRLSLKECARCQAINDRAVQHCYQCGTAFTGQVASSEDQARAACARLQEILRNESALVPPAGAASTRVAPGPTHAATAPAPADPPVFETRAQWQRRTARRKALNTALSTFALLSVAGIAGYLLYDHSYLMQAASSAPPARSSPPTYAPAEQRRSDPVVAGRQAAAPLAMVEVPAVSPAPLPRVEPPPEVISVAAPVPSVNPAATAAVACSEAVAAVGLCGPRTGALDARGPGGAQEPSVVPAVPTPQPPSASVQASSAVESTVRTRVPPAAPTPAPPRPGQPSARVENVACTAALIAAGLCSAEPNPRSP